MSVGLFRLYGIQEHRPTQAVVASRETFGNGFPAGFADNFPTKEFMGDFTSVTSNKGGRVRRQASITSDIDSILNGPYGGALDNDHLQALLLRGANIRFSSPPQGSFRPQQETRSPDLPSPDRPFSPSFFQSPRFSPSRFTPSNPPFHSQPQKRQEPFSSESFTGQQFDSFSDIDSFFDSARLPRQRRDVAAAAAPRDDAGSAQHTFVSPEEGSSPDSVTSLLSQDRGVAGREQAQLDQVGGRREHILGQTSSHPFAVPFVVPNAFELLGIRRRNDISATAQERQGRQVGISDAIDNLLRSPYNGRMPTSLHSLFRSEDRRVVRNPSPHPGLPFHSFTAVGTDNPSLAAVRLFPNGQPPLPPRSHFAVTHHEQPRLFRRTRRDVGQGDDVNFYSDAYHFRAEAVKPRRARHLIPEERSFPLPGKEFGEIIVHYDYGGEDPTDDSGRVVALHDEEVAALLSPFTDRPSDPSSPRERKPRPHTSPRKVNHRPHPSLREEKPRPHPVLGQGMPRPRPRPHPSHPAPARPPPRQRHRHPNHIPAFKPGPSPPAHILPPSSSIRAPRHVLLENQRLPRATRQLDIPLTRRMLLLDDSLDPVPESSSGFIVGKPAGFPEFASIGGFGPMEDVDKTDVAGSFMQTINFPSVDFGPIDDSHPPFPQTPTFPQTPSFPQQKTQDVELDSDVEKTRRRRAVTDEDEEEQTNPYLASLIPHKRVHRVQTETHTPHSRKPREDTDMETSPAEIPQYFSSVSNFEFPRLQPRHRQSPAISRSTHVTSQFSSHYSPAELRREDRHHPPHTQDPDYTQPDGQRFYPSFSGHHISPQISPSSRAPFFPSRPIPPHVPGPRGSRFLTRGVGFRERPNPTPRDPVGFRELHHQGPPVRETSSHITPDAAFSASRRPFHREQEHFGHDNSILGSGNFEVLRGGTFYDLEDTNGHQHYDHLLHGDDFGFFPAVRPPSPPHTNYVDDFFSNFRDFSEFAKRRSDEGESTYVEDEYNPEPYSRGYGSEHIHQFALSNATLEVMNVTLTNVTETNIKSENTNSLPVTEENTTDRPHTTVTGHTQQTHKRPNNIQEVLEEVDPHPSDYTASTTAVEEKDPMIAMF
ncbi:uncharacterized protein LOC135111824 [Scylla paramamosain]|uniref:uncharacterized protein LOC135111824 n=1 Tax=Scylla paramamosain TaxID=85552 RepID=UPI00308308A4